MEFETEQSSTILFAEDLEIMIGVRASSADSRKLMAGESLVEAAVVRGLTVEIY
jgi:hypothetical protein